MGCKFSIIVPIYKVEDYLKKCIESILNQTYTDFELLLIDDGSPDNCPSICDYYAQLDKRIVVIHKENQGLVAARNTGIKTAKGDYICYVDGDDWIEPTLLEKVTTKGLDMCDADIVVYGAKRIFKDREEKIDVGPDKGVYTKNKLESDVYPYMMYDSRKPFCTGLIFPVAWNKIYRRELLLRHYCKDERIRMGEDNAFVFECLYYANTVVFVDDVLYCYNQLNTSSMVHSYDENRFKNNQWLTDYITDQMGGKSPIIDNQINAFKAYWLIMAVFHEVKCERKLMQSVKHIRKNIKETKVLDGIDNVGLPKSAKIFIMLLRLHMNFVALIGAKIINKFR